MGTSMATPIVAGAAVLVRQYFEDGWYPNGSPVSQYGFNPSAPLVKAVMLGATICPTAYLPEVLLEVGTSLVCAAGPRSSTVPFPPGMSAGGAASMQGVTPSSNPLYDGVPLEPAPSVRQVGTVAIHQQQPADGFGCKRLLGIPTVTAGCPISLQGFGRLFLTNALPLDTVPGGPNMQVISVGHS
jgi:hypothetical protein